MATCLKLAHEGGGPRHGFTASAFRGRGVTGAESPPRPAPPACLIGRSRAVLGSLREL